jgi:beta-glucosidase
MGFPLDFLRGVATAAFQIDGATREGGRESSIRDTFCATPGRVENRRHTTHPAQGVGACPAL